MWSCSSAARQAENSLGDDVALDLRGTRVDRRRLCPHPSVLPAAVFDRERGFRRQRTVHAFDAQGGFLEPFVHLAPVELDHARLWARRVTMLSLGQIAQADEAEYVRFDLGLGDLLSSRGVGAGAAVPRQRGELGHRALEPGSLRKSAAFEPKHGHRDLPAIPRSADEVAVVDLRSRKEDLAELTATRHLLDPPHLDGRLLHVDQEEADAAMRLIGGAGACEQEAPVRVVRPARPCLLAAQDPLSVAPLRTRAQPCEIAPGVGLAESLAEDQLAAQDLLEVGLFLPGSPVRNQGRGEKRDTQPSQDSGSAGVGKLLLVDRLHDRRRTAASGFLGPPELEPASLVQPPLPVPLKLGVLLVPVTTLAALAPLARKVRFEPATNLVPEGFLLGRESEIHGSERSKNGQTESRDGI